MGNDHRESGELSVDKNTKMDELYDEKRASRAEVPPTAERQREWRLVAQRAIESSLELADEMEAA